MLTSPIKLEAIKLHVVKLPMVEPFVSSQGTVSDREQIIVEVVGEGTSGWGEAAVLPVPFYMAETPKTALHILSDFLIPLVLKAQPQNPEQLTASFSHIVGNPGAKAGVELAFWDWYAKLLNQPLYKLLGGLHDEIPVGVSLPLYKDTATLIDRVEKFLADGYPRIKIKISPGRDLDLVSAIFSKFPQIHLMVDANASYTLNSLQDLKKLDDYPLLMIEQPLRHGDLLEHAKLQQQLKTPICLDESISNRFDAIASIQLGSCKIANIKPSRVGGLIESIAIHDIFRDARLGVWCGGMLETGIGRAHNMALATLPNFIFPGDISESSRYYHEDLLETPITLTPGGTLKLRDNPGIGFAVCRKVLGKYSLVTS